MPSGLQIQSPSTRLGAARSSRTAATVLGLPYARQPQADPRAGRAAGPSAASATSKTSDPGHTPQLGVQLAARRRVSRRKYLNSTLAGTARCAGSSL
jgi:hypothetical protein